MADWTYENGAPVQQTPPSEIVADLQAFLAVLPEDEQARLRDVIAQRRKVQNVSEYHAKLFARVNAEDPDSLAKLEHPSYMVLGSFHEHITPEALQECAAKNEELRKQQMAATGTFNPNRLINPRKRVYVKGQTVTPITDGEALMMLQNPEKFQPKMSQQPVDRVQELLAERDKDKAELTRLRELVAANAN